MTPRDVGEGMVSVTVGSVSGFATVAVVTAVAAPLGVASTVLTLLTALVVCQIGITVTEEYVWGNTRTSAGGRR